MLAGGAVAGATGQNVMAGAAAGENEAMNNCAFHECWNNVKSWVATAAPAAGASFLNAFQQAAAQLYDNTFYSGLPGTGGPQSALYQSVLQNGLLGAAQSAGTNLLNIANGIWRGDPSAIGSLTGSVLAGMAGGAVLGGAGRALTGETGATVGTFATNSSTSAATGGADFYVTSGGTAVPATGYRAVGGPAVAEAQAGTIAPRNPTYITFDNITNMSPSAAQSLLQLPRTPTNWVSFDTLPLINDLTIPTGKWNTTTTLEPITNTFPEWGSGGGTQAITNQPIQVKGFGTLPTGAGK
jgi:hypothetical protein